VPGFVGLGLMAQGLGDLDLVAVRKAVANLAHH